MFHERGKKNDEFVINRLLGDKLVWKSHGRCLRLTIPLFSWNVTSTTEQMTHRKMQNSIKCSLRSNGTLVRNSPETIAELHSTDAQRKRVQ